MLPNRTRKRPVDFEGREQQMLVSWMQLQHKAAFAVAWHTPNGGAVSKGQKEMLSRLQQEGYRAVVCRGINEAMTEINAYLALPPTAGMNP